MFQVKYLNNEMCLKLMTLFSKVAQTIIRNYPLIPEMIKLSNTKKSSLQKRIDIGMDIMNFKGNILFI